MLRAYGPYFPREASPSRGGAEGPVANSSMIRVPKKRGCSSSLVRFGTWADTTATQTDAMSAEATV